jgi:hypothetical protein
MFRKLSEREAKEKGIQYFSHVLGVLEVKMDVMTEDELHKLLETLEREFVERMWFTKYRTLKDEKGVTDRPIKRM